MTTRARFRLATFLIPLVLVALLAASFTVHPHVPQQATPAIDPADYGHVQAYDGYAIFTLGPNGQQSAKYELGLGRAAWRITGVYVSDDGQKYYPLTNAEQVGACGGHAWGYGLNVLVMAGKCVPGWATVTGDPQGTHAGQWLRIQNLSLKARRVLVKYDPLP